MLCLDFVMGDLYYWIRFLAIKANVIKTLGGSHHLILGVHVHVLSVVQVEMLSTEVYLSTKR